MAREDYFNPFPKQPLRLLWYADDLLHKFNVRNKLSKSLCNYLDDRLWDGTEEFFGEQVNG